MVSYNSILFFRVEQILNMPELFFYNYFKQGAYIQLLRKVWLNEIEIANFIVVACECVLCTDIAKRF